MSEPPIRLELPTPFSAGPVNVYLFTAPEPVLVDTGMRSAESWQALVAGLAAHGLAVGDLARVVITHPHIDHCGQAAHIVSRSQAQVWGSEIAHEWLVDTPGMWHKRISYYADYFLPKTGLPAEAVQLMLDYMTYEAQTAVSVPTHRLCTFPIDGQIKLGGLVWQVLYMPGHTNYQTCFYQPETRQFLSADMLLAKTPAPIVERPLSDAASGDGSANRLPALPQFLHSLDRVEKLDIDIVYPGHGEIFTNHRQVIQQQRQRIQQRKAECLALVAGGCQTIAALTSTMYAHLSPEARFAGLWMLVGYLDLLKAENSIIETDVAGVWHYTAIE